MGYLSLLFFCMSPFALFCSENGNGLILCPVFIILGFIFKWLENRCNEPPKVVMKIEPEKYWEDMYTSRIRTVLSKGGHRVSFIAYEDEKAREWATTACQFYGIRPPSEDVQEQIAKDNGVVTQKMNESTDRVQFGKYYLMKKVIDTYKEKMDEYSYGDPERQELEYVIACLKRLRESITYTNIATVYRTSLVECRERFGTHDEDKIWENVLSQEEKCHAEQWIKEYMEKFKKENEDKGTCLYVMRDYDYLKKHGFAI